MKRPCQIVLTVVIGGPVAGGWFWLGAAQDVEGSGDAGPRPSGGGGAAW